MLLACCKHVALMYTENSTSYLLNRIYTKNIHFPMETLLLLLLLLQLLLGQLLLLLLLLLLGTINMYICIYIYIYIQCFVAGPRCIYVYI
jgi:hypothetical protein